jgi:hypothetical protein
MLMQLVVPRTDRAIQAYSMFRWLKAPGDTVSYGDDICELKVAAMVRMKRSTNPGFVLKKMLAPKADIGQHGDVKVIIRLTASDTGVLRQTLVSEGSPVKIGDTVAWLSTDPSENIGAVETAGSATQFRVVTNFV